jgi:large repetitive protein
MNKSYKSIWNETLGTYVAASEAATAGGRKVSSGRKARRAPERAHSSQIALEQRIVFDAALPATVVETSVDKAPAETAVVDEVEAEDPVEAPAPIAVAVAPAASEEAEDDSATADVSEQETAVEQPADLLLTAEPGDELAVETDGTDTDAENVDPPLESTAASDEVSEQEAAALDADSEERVEVIFIDSVAAELGNHLQWHPAEVYVLDANRDGVEQMAEILNGRTGIDAVHIISHGTPGQLQLGNAVLNGTTLAGEHADELAVIRAALSEEADLLLYGCEVSSTPEGESFVAALANATGADVLASDDNTGTEMLGGDWVLETQVGDSIETTVITATEWAGVLTTPANVGAGAVLGTVGKQIYSIDLTTGKATLLTTVPATVGGISTGALQNSLAVNQAAGLIYYVSNDSANTNRALFAYDFINNVHILVDADLTSNGTAGNIAVGDRGVGSGGAVYANGALYFGVENNAGGDAVGALDDDSIYRIVLSADGRSVATAAGSVTLLVANITGNDWGDLGYSASTNSLLSSQTTSIIRYTLNAGGTAVTATATLANNGSGPTNTQMAESQAGNNYRLGTQIQQIDPTTGATIGTAVNITTNGTTALGAVNDAASWTPPTANIGDRIFTDTNSNGTFDGTDSGIAGVTVRLVDDVNNNGVVDAGERVLAIDTTDVNGNYLFTGVLPGNYIVQVTDTGGVLGTGRTYTTAGGNTNPNADVTQIGSTNLAIDFGLNNRAPVNVVPGAQTMPEDGTLNITGVSTSDPDGNLSTTQLTVTNGVLNVSLAGGATISAGANGSSTLTLSGTAAQINAALASISYQPTTNYFGPAVLTVRSTDVAGLQDTDTVNITVNPVNDPPVDGNETNTVTEDTTLTVADGAAGDLLNNATDVDGGTPVITQFTVAGNPTSFTAGQTATIAGVGALTINANGSYSFAPALNYTGPIPVATYTVSDGNGGTDTSTLTLNITAVNDAPVDGNETNTVTEDTTLTVADGAAGDLLNNASDVDGDALSITQFTVAGNPTSFTAGQTATIAGVGALTINANGSYSFAPASNYTGPIPVATYTVSDGNGGTDTSTLTLNIAAVNDAPVDGNETNTVTEDTTLTVADGAAGDLLNNSTDVDGGTPVITDFTVDGNTLTAGQTATIAGVGALTINANGSYSFVPEPNYAGAIPVATYTVSDGNGGTDTSTLTLNIAAVNDLPVDGNETNTVTEDTTLTVADGAAGDLLNNASDVDGDALSITQFTVDGNTLTAGQTATIAGVGALTINANGSYTFVPEPNYAGAIPVATYTVSDGNGGTDTSTLTLNITAVNDAPVDGNETNTVTEDTTLTVADGSPQDLLANATDVEGSPLTITDFTVDGNTLTAGQTATIAGVGALTINANGSYTFVPEPNYAGAIPVATYTVSDGNGGTDTSTLTLNIAAVNDAPVDGNETNTVTEDTTLTVADGSPQDLLANATDVEGNPLTITDFTVDGNTLTAGQTATIAGVGALTINANGSYTFVPEPNYAGAIPVATYTVSDGNGGTDTSTLTLNIAAVNDAPVDGNETNTVTEDTTLTVADGSPQDLLANATDVEGSPLTITDFTVDGNTLTAGQTATIAGVGALTINANGSYTFVPEPNYAGAIPVATYTVSDGNGGTDTSTLTLNIAAVNDLPVDGNETNTVTEDTTLTVADGAAGDLLNNASDVDGDALSITQFTVDGNTLTAGQTATIAGVGALTINANGSYTFVPEPNYAGAIPVATYTVSDGNGGTDTSTLTLNITAVNDAPVDGNETNTVTEDTTLTVADGSPQDLLANATDVEGNR